MNALNLQLYMQALATLARVEGMRADNAARDARGDSPCHDASDFEYLARELDRLAQEVNHD